MENQNHPQIIESITKWFRTAVPEPNAETLSVQVGCHFEEVAEMIDELRGCGCPANAVSRLAHSYKSYATVEILDPVAFLDALCDQIVTAIGVGHMMGFDMAAALEEVNRSNYSKFVDGLPVFDANGKISKGPDYSAPELGQFVRGGDHD